MEALLLGVLASLIGSAYLLYGRRQSEPWFIACGVALVGYPYVVSGPLAMTAVGVALAALPFVMR